MKISVHFVLGLQSNFGESVFLFHLFYIVDDRKNSLFEGDYSLIRCDTCFKFQFSRRLNNMLHFVAQPNSQRKKPFQGLAVSKLYRVLII